MMNLRNCPPRKTYAEHEQQPKPRHARRDLARLRARFLAQRYFERGGDLYGEGYDLVELEELRERLRVPEQLPRDFVVDDFGQLDWGGCELGA